MFPFLHFAAILHVSQGNRKCFHNTPEDLGGIGNTYLSDYQQGSPSLPPLGYSPAPHAAGVSVGEPCNDKGCTLLGEQMPDTCAKYTYVSSHYGSDFAGEMETSRENRKCFHNTQVFPF